MGFQQGLSGLNAASKSLEAIGNNVANAQTVGFKASQAQFADVYASSLNGAGDNSTGIGVKTSQIAQQFTQGNVSSSNNPLDIAINGNGFFRMSTNGAITYGRNGQFQLDKDGFITSASGARLTGLAASPTGAIVEGNVVELQIGSAGGKPLQTSEIDIAANLDVRSAIPPTAAFDPTDPTSYNSATSVSVFDSLGNAHVLQTFFVKTGPVTGTPGKGTWDVYGTSDGKPIGSVPPAPAVPLGELTFGFDGLLEAPTSFSAVTIPGSDAADPAFDVEIEFAGSTQFGSNFAVNKLAQDGYADGALSGFNVGSDGTITGRYTNGQSLALGRVELTSFANPNGLQPLGNNVWAESYESGAPKSGTPGSGRLGVLQSSAVEDSNVDLTAELVNMITAQRFYQANAQTIKTQDQVLQTLVNLR